jgi:hypothetical protein
VGDGQLFTDQEAEEILQRASRGTTGGISENRLVRMADELGISLEAVKAAADEVRQETEEKRDRREFALRQRRSFFNNLLSYACTCGGLVALNYFLEGRVTWAWWVVGGWGFAILNDVRETFAPGSADYEKAFNKWRKRRQQGLPEPATPKIGIHIHSSTSRADEAEPATQSLTS